MGTSRDDWWREFVQQLATIELHPGAGPGNHATVNVAWRELTRLLEEQDRTGPCLTLGRPGRDPGWQNRWIGNRLVFWPEGVSQARTRGVLSSRIGRDWSRVSDWFDLLRTVVAELGTSNDGLVSVEGTTADRFLVRAATRLACPFVRIRPAGRRVSRCLNWLKRVRTLASQRDRSPLDVWVSPALGGEMREERAALPLSDRLLVAWADEIDVLKARPGGAIERLVSELLQDPPAGGVVHLATRHPPMISESLAAWWVERGAQLRVPAQIPNLVPALATSVGDPAGGAGANDESNSTAPRARIVGPEEWQGFEWSNYLIHGTRAAWGPWPDQPEVEFLDEWLLGRVRPDRSALAALRRIMEMKKILASDVAIRGGSRGVSFTAVPLAERRQRRTFRAHRGRWDFEPYGVCVPRVWLVERGARPVIYGDESTWRALAPQDRPFFQRASSTVASRAEPIDWTLEREWRHLGDVDLSRVSEPPVLIFVARRAEAELLAETSPWPILVIDGANEL